MTREQFVKYKFRAYMRIDYKHPRLEEPIEYILVAIDFDNETMTLTSAYSNYEDKELVTTISHCFLPRFTIKK